MWYFVYRNGRASRPFRNLELARSFASWVRFSHPDPTYRIEIRVMDETIIETF